MLSQRIVPPALGIGAAPTLHHAPPGPAIPKRNQCDNVAIVEQTIPVVVSSSLRPPPNPAYSHGLIPLLGGAMPLSHPVFAAPSVPACIQGHSLWSPSNRISIRRIICPLSYPLIDVCLATGATAYGTNGHYCSACLRPGIRLEAPHPGGHIWYVYYCCPCFARSGVINILTAQIPWLANLCTWHKWLVLL